MNPVTEYRICPKCGSVGGSGKKVKMTRCEHCKGGGCHNCERNGWFCPTHGSHY